MSNTATTPIMTSRVDKGMNRWILPGIFLIIGVLAPFILPGDKWVRVAALALVYVALASGLNILVGLTGLLDLGYIAFFIVGAYTAAILTTRAFSGFLSENPVLLWLVLPVSILLAIIFAGIAGAIIGYPTLRARGDYLAIMTLGFGEIVRIVSINWVDVTGGAVGIRGVTPLSFTGEGAVSATANYYTLFIAVSIMLMLLASLIASPVGRAWVAIREDQLVAASIGIHTRRYKLMAYVMGATIAGIIGVFFAHMQQFVNPDSFTLEDNFIVLSLVILGGTGTYWGPILGAVFWIFFQAVARDIEFVQQHPEFRMGTLALIVIILMILRPGGVVSKRLVLTRAKTSNMPPEGLELHPTNREKAVGETVLDLKDVGQKFGGLIALESVSFKLRRGEILGLMGPNGAGKSTLINAVSGVTPPTSGEIIFGDKPLQNLESNRVSTLGIARTFQTVRLFWDMTVLENLLVGGHSRVAGFIPKFLTLIPVAKPKETRVVTEAENILSFVGAWELRDRVSKSLDAYAQRRVEIARALMTRPKILLLDEPAAGLNESETQRLAALIRKINAQGIDIILIEHDMDLLMGVSDRVVVLDHGVIIADGTPAEIRQNDKVLEAYLGSD